MRFRFFGFTVSIISLTIILYGCMDYGPHSLEEFPVSPEGLFVVNEGNFTYGNASLSYYDPVTCHVENEAFIRTNGFKLGDVAQSMAIRNGKGYIAVNNSGVIFVIDLKTLRCLGYIANLSSPRYIHFVNDHKAYVTDLYAFTITVFDPQTLQIIKKINTKFGDKAWPSTEQMVQFENKVFVNCWSYDNRILVIDTDTDTVTDQIIVGNQPTSLVLDRYGKIWVTTDGGYEGSSMGNEPAKLYRIDARTHEIERVFTFGEQETASELAIDGQGENIYFINKHIWKMDVTSTVFPSEPFLYNDTHNKWYGLTVDPRNSEIYLADAIDYSQPGTVYRYSSKGQLLDSFDAGIIPGAFCFNFNMEEE